MTRPTLGAARPRALLALAVASCLVCAAPAAAQELWYEAPAAAWLEALPVGNGHLGAMVFGGAPRERLQLNEDSLWPGRPEPRFDKGDPGTLARMRERLFAGEEAEVSAEIMGLFAAGRVVRSHQTAGDLWLELRGDAEATDYRRALDLASGVARTEFTRAGAHHAREVFASAPDDVLVLHETVQGGLLDLELRYDRAEEGGHATFDARTEAFAGGGRIVVDGRLTQAETPYDNGVAPNPFRVLVEARTDGGRVVAEDGRLAVHGAHALTVLVAIEGVGAPRGRADGILAEAARRAVDELRARHVADHDELFGRVALDLGRGEGADAPTDRRLAAAAAGVLEPDLAALLFQYGRYLLIACSRPGSQPANLQGLWNEHVAAPWNADYHLNVNLQMNYWPAEVANLAECHLPLVDFTERLAARGAVRARQSFGCGGWVGPHASDFWASAWTRSDQPYWGFWHNGGAWLCRHVWDHWLYGGDRAFLARRAWPLLRGAAEFACDWLVEDPRTHLLVSGPSTSPENSFRTADGRAASVCMGPAMDQQILCELLDHTLAAAAELAIEDAFVQRVRDTRAHLADGLTVAPDGRLLEWNQEVQEVEPGHRHVSHLYALHPGDAIDPLETPALAHAARATLEYRLAHGGAGTGWSRAWTVNWYARLHDGDAAHEHLRALLARSMAPNLFDLHPPFQIDGNFGATSGVAEMLLQARGDRVELLPALPTAWPEGSVRGLRAPGGLEIDLEWRDGRLARARLRATGADVLVRPWSPHGALRTAGGAPLAEERLRVPAGGEVLLELAP